MRLPSLSEVLTHSQHRYEHTRPSQKEIYLTNQQSMEYQGDVLNSSEAHALQNKRRELPPHAHTKRQSEYNFESNSDIVHLHSKEFPKVKKGRN